MREENESFISLLPSYLNLTLFKIYLDSLSLELKDIYLFRNFNTAPYITYE